eukprot:99993_1
MAQELKDNEVDKYEYDSEEYANQEVIVNEHDLRIKATKSDDKNESIMQCIGHLESHYIYDAHGGYRKSTAGTATVFYVGSNGKTFIVSCAHNVRTLVWRCNQCQKYMDKKKKHGKCGMNDFSEILIKANRINFVKRCIYKKYEKVMDDDSKKQIIEYGDIEKVYECDPDNIFIDEHAYGAFPTGSSGYDLSVICFKKKTNDYKNLVKNIRIKNGEHTIKEMGHFSIFGFPGDKCQTVNGKQEQEGLYGMKSHKNGSFEFKMHTKTGKKYFKQNTVDAFEGQSGSSIWVKAKEPGALFGTRDIIAICGVHTGGSSRNKNNKYNVGVLFDDFIIKQIINFINGKTVEFDTQKFKKILTGCNTQNYGKLLTGYEAFTTFKLCIRKSDKKPFKVKIVDKRNLSGRQLVGLKDEIRILKSIEFPHVIQLIDVFDDGRRVQLVLELCEGGDLFDQILKSPKRRFEESKCAEITYILARTLKYLHDHYIIHRNLKPENILFTKNGILKIVNFGLSHYLKLPPSLHVMHTCCGSPHYVAPEILSSNEYTHEADLWSLGVILYVLLCGYQPFNSHSITAMYGMIIRGQYKFPSSHWDSISNDAKDLVKKLLCVDCKKRYTVHQVLKHQWIEKNVDLKKVQSHKEKVSKLTMLQNKTTKHAAMKLLWIEKVDLKKVQSHKEKVSKLTMLQNKTTKHAAMKLLWIEKVDLKKVQ